MRYTSLGIQRGTKILPSRESINVLAKEKKSWNLEYYQQVWDNLVYMVGTQLAQYRLSITFPGRMFFWWLHGSL